MGLANKEPIDVDATDKYGQRYHFFTCLIISILNHDTPIHRAAQYGHTDIVQALLKYGAGTQITFSHTNHNQILPPPILLETLPFTYLVHTNLISINFSVGTGKLSVSKLLLDKGASIFVPNSQQSFPYDKALLLNKTQPRVMPPQLLKETEKLLQS